MKRQYLVSLLVSFLFCFAAMAQNQIKLDLEGLSDSQKAELLLKAEQMKKEKTAGSLGEIATGNMSPAKLNEWVELGKNVGLAMTSVAKELGVASDQFLNSKTGKITMVLIVWKVMGKDILGVIGGTLAWIVLATIVIWSFKFFHMKKKVKDKDGKVGYVSRYNFNTDDAKVGSAVAHLVAFATVTIACMVIIFS